jgi:hypothetical protein
VVYSDASWRLRAATAKWRTQKLIDYQVERSIRDTFRLLRNTIDLIGEFAFDHPRLGTSQSPLTAFDGGEPQCRINPDALTGSLRFEPGDVIVQRGRRHNSAAIARIGEIDSQFSHAAIVARANDGALVAVEALIEEGAVVTPLETAMAHGIGRAALFRHQDRALAVAASQAVYDCVVLAQPPRASRILYDFSMELDDYKRLFCAKLIRLAFDRGSAGRVLLPRHPTRLDFGSRDFLSKIGVTARQTFAPGDLDMEPDFQLVAEWRDFRMTSELRLKDFVMVKLFEWMDRYGYRFKPDLLMRLVATLGRLSTYLGRDLRDLVGEIVAKVPPNMSRSAIAAVAMLHETAEPVYQELQLLEDETIRATGFQLQPAQAFRALERYRARRGGRIGYLARRETRARVP